MVCGVALWGGVKSGENIRGRWNFRATAVPFSYTNTKLAKMNFVPLKNFSTKRSGRKKFSSSSRLKFNMAANKKTW